MKKGPNIGHALADVVTIDGEGDFDGIQLGDVDGDGRLEIVASTGKDGAVYWYDHDPSKAVAPGAGSAADRPGRAWTRHTISTGHVEIEGNDLADFDGDGVLEAISLDQKAGTVLIHKPDRHDVRGTWTTVALLEDRPFLQDSLAADLTGSGRPDLIYTWEGSGKGEGGVHCLTLEGPDPLNPLDWRDIPLLTHEGAWWLVPRFLDLSGRGVARDLVFTARNLVNRNAASRPGVYWLEAPASGDAADPWRRHVIDRSIPHPLHVDAGCLGGDPGGRDLVVGDWEGSGVFLFYFHPAKGFSRRPMPNPAGGDRVFNACVARIDDRTPQQLLAAVAHGGVYLYRWEQGGHRPQRLFPVAGHPLDDRILWHDLDGDGLREAFIPDSGGRRLIMLHFRQDLSGL